MLFSHTRQLADFSFTRKFRHAIHIADLVGAPDQRDGLGAESLNFQQLQHGRVILLQQSGLHGELAGIKEFLQVGQHPFADAGNGEHLLGIADDVLQLMCVAFDGLRGIAVGANAERILPINFEQVGRLVEDVGDCLVIHMLKINKNGEQG